MLKEFLSFTDIYKIYRASLVVPGGSAVKNLPANAFSNYGQREVHDIVQKAVIKTMPKKKKCKKAKALSDEALQIAEKRRGAKGKGEKERYTHLNAEFQRTARRDKKAFLSDQC